MGFPSEHIIPWELISDAFQGNLSIEEQAQLQQWISSSAENQELFSQLKNIWDEGLNEYIIYREADETGAWNALHSRMTGQSSEVKKPTHVITGDFTKRRIKLMRWVSVAAVLVIAMGTIIWYMANRSGNIYQTGPGEEQTVSLPDGSSIKLYSATVIELSKDYNKSARIVTLKEGEAFFEVKHDANVPFIVNMETTRVEDLGTSFFIQKKKDSIKVSVISGKVAFVNKASNEARELSAGMSLKFQAGKKIF
jgi:transmembrane sensor